MYLDVYRQSIPTWIQEGLSDRGIAERVRVSPSTVRYWRERNRVERPPRDRGVGSRDESDRNSPSPERAGS